jgi:GT2 family glycosyltransferase
VASAQPRVAAVVLNYNGLEVTRQAVASLRAMTYGDCELVVLDNGSTDGSFEALAREFPGLRQERIEVNRGASAGYSHGMRWAMERGFDYVLLLNNDIEVEPSLLAELVAVAESAADLGCVGPKCYFHAERRRLWSAGGLLRYRESVTHERGHGEIDHGQFDRDEEVPYVNGCAILVRRSAIAAAGLWDPIFHICVDDADFCTRVKLAGLRCAYAHRAVLYHRVAYTTGGRTERRNFAYGRSSAIYARRYGSAGQRLRFRFFLAASALFGLVREPLRGRSPRVALAKWRGAREGFRCELPEPPKFEDPRVPG